jgi:serine protease Do
MTMTRRTLAVWVVVAGLTGAGIGAVAVGSLAQPTAGVPAPSAPLIRVAAPESSNTFRQVAAAVGPAVININTVTVVRNPFAGQRSPMEEFFGEEFFRRFFGGPREFTQRSLGSGVIVDASGVALTNAHVVEGASEIEVVSAEGKKHKAKVLGSDARSDIAVLKLQDGKNYPSARLGDSDGMQVGDWVLAIGSPFGFTQSVTAGIISAKSRVLDAGPITDFLQTDAAINPGNSGGPLVNMAGEVIGINTAIASRSGGYQGVGFAIPINIAKRIYTELTTRGKVTRGWLGVSVQALTSELAKSFGAGEDAGVLVADVVEGSPAEKGGVKSGDIIVEFNGKKVTAPGDLQRAVGLSGPGSTAKLKILRDKAERTIELKIGEAPDDAAVAARTPGAKAKSLLGLEVKPLTADVARQLGLRSSDGVVVVGVEDGSPAEGAGIQAGDVVREVNRTKVRSLAEFERATQGLKSGDRVTLLLQRGGSALFVAFTVGRG